MKKACTYFTLILLLVTESNKGIAQVNVSDSLALVDMYNSMNGSNWTVKTNWLQASPLYTWEGVIVTGDRVTGISFEFNNNIAGTLSTSIGNLSELKSVHISNNNITGSIPSSFSKLTKLESFAIQFCNLSGSIPSFIGKLPNLYYLNLQSNQITGRIPASVGANPILRYVMLGFNQLSGSLPASFGANPNLEILGVSNNQLSGTVSNFITTHLTNLFLDHNSFTGTIPDFHLTPWIDECDLSHNQFSGGIPEWLGNMTSYSNLLLAYNNLSGEIPRNFGNLKTYWIDISNNQLAGNVPSTFLNRPWYSLTYLDNNQFTFEGIDTIVSSNPAFTFGYNPQSFIPIHLSNQGNYGKLSVYAGGALGDNTYNWYRNNVLYKTFVGDSTFLPDSTGSYFVRVTNSVVNNLILNSDTITINEPCVFAPVNTVTSNVQSNSATLSWNSSPGAIRYQVRYKADNGTFTTVNTNNSSLTLTGLLPNTKYTWKVRAICSSSSSPYTSNVVFRTTNNLTVGESAQLQVKQASVRVSPNPASSYADISFIASKQADYSIKLYDMQGRLLQVKTGLSVAGRNNARLYIGNITKGMYVVEVICGDKSYVSKFVKQ